MNIVQITPGAGAMYCGNCFRDNTLVKALRQLGHSVQLVPIYLPLTLEEEDQSAGTPLFFNGINVYLEQKSALFRSAPDWFHNLLSSPRLLKWAAGRAAKTRAADLGELTLSMLVGEEGNQARELEDLIRWLKKQPKPDVICLSNVLLVGQVRSLKAELGAPVVCTLQGEDYFLDGLPESHRALCWKILADRATDVDLFIAPSRYFAGVMQDRLGLSADRIRVVYNGISLDGYSAEGRGSSDANSARNARSSTLDTRHSSPILGYFARMCREKGLDTLVEAYILLRQSNESILKSLRLRIGGSCGPADQTFVESLRKRLEAAGVLDSVEFCPNLDRTKKLEFLHSLSLFSVPARYGEAFGLYLIEAMAAGVPVVQPRAASFSELIDATGGGLLFDAEDACALAGGLKELLLNADKARAFGEAGRRCVVGQFSAEVMARGTLEAYEEAINKSEGRMPKSERTPNHEVRT
jgi:glycosyltransferase involved in cell wall biosynthesis